jgi:alanyl-tRNA synthetase
MTEGNTKRLYHLDPYQTSFHAIIKAVLPEYVIPSDVPAKKPQTGFGVVLDQTAFYPKSGGQLNDVGTLAVVNGDGDDSNHEQEFKVVDVVLEEAIGSVVHIIAFSTQQQQQEQEGNGSIFEVGKKVIGKVDWMTRLDHMQQHHGQHILSAVFDKAGIETVSFHMNKNISYIDLNSANISEELVAKVQQSVNDVILSKPAVTSSFYSLEEAKKLPLRKDLDPNVIQEPVRIVKIGDFDIEPCCGTHPHNSYEVGSLVILGTEKIKKTTRLSFICGVRVTAYATTSAQLLKRLASKLGCGPDNVEQVLSNTLVASATVRKQLTDAEKLVVQKVAKEIYEENGKDSKSESFKVFSRVLDGDLAIIGDLGNMRTLAKSPIFQSKCLIILLSPSESSNAVNFIISASDDLVKANVIDLRNWIKEIFKKIPGKGGGASTMIQGSFINTLSSQSILEEILNSLKGI